MKQNATKTNLFLFPLLFALALTGCGKDEKSDPDPSPTVKSQLQGSWQKRLIRLQYYDAAGKMDFEDLVTEENDYVYTFDENTMTADYNDSSPLDVATYEIRSRGEKNYVHLSNGTDEVENEILKLNSSELIWQDEYEYLNYSKGNVSKTADHAIYIEEFDKQ